jgi:hypothetical protein
MTAQRLAWARDVRPGDLVADGRMVVGAREYPETGTVMLALEDGTHRFVYGSWRLPLAEPTSVPDYVPDDLARVPARPRPCGCECCHGGFCGGCGHAGCGGRR